MKMIGQEVTTKTVDELKELVDATDIPFCVKGVLSAGDALCAIDAGVKYIIVSNHGGRITQNQPSPICVLPEIKKAVGNKAKLILDGGIRSGEDIFKALAILAKIFSNGNANITINNTKRINIDSLLITLSFINITSINNIKTTKDDL